MPRGNWDRSKTKEQRAAEKAALKKGGGKIGRKAKVSVTAAPAKKKYAKPHVKSEALKGASPKADEGMGHAPAVDLNPRAFSDLQLLQHHFSVLHGASAEVFARHPGLMPDLAGEMKSTLDDLAAVRKNLFGHHHTATYAGKSMKEEEATEKTGAEPVTFANAEIPKLGRTKKSKATEPAPEQAAAPSPAPAAEAPAQAPAPLLPTAEAPPAAFTQAPAPFPPNGAVSS